MLSKAKLKRYQQLGSKKFRQKYGLFVVEGLKSVNELAKTNWPVDCILSTLDFKGNINQKFKQQTYKIDRVDFDKITQLKKSQQILAIAKIHQPVVKPSDWKLALDDINDPGNLGTIIRIADWYGITEIYCSSKTVDEFNSKVIQSSMGSFLRVKITRGHLSTLLKNQLVFATLLNGKNIREIEQSKKGVILIGNEANGINPSLLSQIKYSPVTIPSSGKAESLNAAIAAALCCERLTT